MTMTPVPMPRPPAITPQPIPGPTTSVAVKRESYFRSTPVTVRIEIRTTEADALPRLEAAYELACRQLLALEENATA